MIADDVFRQQDKMPSGAVDDVCSSFGVHGFVVVHRVASAACAISLGTDDRFERNELRSVRLGIGFAGFVDTLAIIEQVLDAVHVTMVSQRDGVHACPDTFIYYLIHFRQAVQQRIMGVHM